MNLHFLIPGDINTLSGDYIYDKRIIEGLKAKGHHVTIYPLRNDFPFPSEQSVIHCQKIVDSLPVKEKVIVEGKAMGAIPTVLKDLMVKNPVISLIHIPLASDPNYSAYQRTMITSMERQAYQYVTAFITSSEYASEQLNYLGVESRLIHLVHPGLDKFPVRKNFPDVPSKLLSVANLSRNRDHSVLFRALAALQHKTWTLDCYGNLPSDREYFSDLQSLIRRNNLQGKIFIHGEISGKELSEAYLNADLFVHPADFATYGASLLEALSHGIPVIASTGGGIPKTVPANMAEFFKPGDVYGLQSILEELFDNPILYKKLHTNASTFHEKAQSWEKSVDAFESVLMNI